MIKKPSHFKVHGATERAFTIALRKVARHSAGIVMPHVDGARLINEAALMRRIKDYEEALELWADALVRRTHAGLDKGVVRSFNKALQERQGTEINPIYAKVGPVFASHSLGKELSRLLHKQSAGSLGIHAAELHAQQAKLIKSIPREAAERAQKLAREAMMNGDRAAAVAVELAQTENVTLSRATLISRTEISKTHTALTQARAESVGSTHYQWDAVMDADTRESHIAMDGKIIAWNEEPEVEPGKHYHAGCFPNCRCVALPVLPGE